MTGQLARFAALVALAAALAGCAEKAHDEDPLAGLTVVPEDQAGLPFAELSDAWQQRFDEGDVLFDQRYLDAQGLGPVFIRPGCASCHDRDGRGPGAVRKMVIVEADGVTPSADQSALPFGHTVRPQRADGATVAITAPEDRSDVLVTTRFPPAVFGRGYLEAIADSEIERVEAEQAKRSDGVSGRINHVVYESEHNGDTRFHSHAPGETLIGRFGLKARVATLDDFAADALQGDMGITSPMRPDELPNPAAPDDALPGEDVDIDVVNHLADYMRLLRIPKRDERITKGEGAALFERAGCDSCHVPALRTSDDYPIAELAGIEAPVYTDMLLHDMGEGFSDALADFDASGSEWRTPPLVGLRHLRNYLHDGRAKTVEDAITLHDAKGSEAHASLQKLQALSAEQRAALIEFVSAL